MKKGFAPILIIILLVSFAILGTIAYLQFKPRTQTQSQITSSQFTPTPQATSNLSQTIPSESKTFYDCKINKPSEEENLNEWRTIESKRIGLLFKYPKQASLIEITDEKFLPEAYGYYENHLINFYLCIGKQTSITDLNEGLPIIISEVFKNNKMLYQIADEITGEGTKPVGQGGYIRTDLNKININNHIAYEATFRSQEPGKPLDAAKGKIADFKLIYFEQQGKVYELNVAFLGNYAEEYRKIFNQILSTFKFLN